MFKIDNYSWNSSGINIIIEDINIDEAKKAMRLFSIEDEDQYEDGELPIYADDISNIFLLEEEFIESKKRNLQDVLDKMNEKEYNTPFYYYSKTKGKLIKIDEIYKFEDIDFLNNILRNNVINSKKYANSDFYISPNIFETIKKMIEKYDNNGKDSLYYEVLIYLRELFTLLVISEKTEINIEKNKTYFEFVLSSELYGNIIKKVEWANWDSLSSSLYFSLYEWITDEIIEDLSQEKNEYNQKQAKLRLNLVRSHLKEKKGFIIKNNSIDELNSILSRVHKNETEEYFKQQNKLKDEMIELSKDEINSKRSITNRVIGLITTVSVGIFTQFFETDITNLEELLSPNFTIAIVFGFSFFTIFFFIFSLVLDIKERIQYYKKLKKNVH